MKTQSNMAMQDLPEQPLISKSQDLRRRALQGLGTQAEAARCETELRRRFLMDPLSPLFLPKSTVENIEPDKHLTGLSAITSKFIVATADLTTQSDGALQDLLHNVRVLLQMDIAFVAEFVEGQKVFRHLDNAEHIKLPFKEGDCGPLELTLCQRVVDGRLPELLNDAKSVPELWDLMIAKTLNIGAYLSTPVVLQCGTVYGTLCCISHSARSALGNKQIDALRHVAKILGAELDKRRP
ncbi:GAF domain-containing protein [Flavobacterium sp.]|uniref:GAF domain-containing protein n=1 Tax=Flavobacterium sp. TaxID=239 RepID=UPI003C5972E2